MCRIASTEPEKLYRQFVRVRSASECDTRAIRHGIGLFVTRMGWDGDAMLAGWLAGWRRHLLIAFESSRFFALHRTAMYSKERRNALVLVKVIFHLDAAAAPELDMEKRTK